MPDQPNPDIAAQINSVAAEHRGKWLRGELPAAAELESGHQRHRLEVSREELEGRLRLHAANLDEVLGRITARTADRRMAEELATLREWVRADQGEIIADLFHRPTYSPGLDPSRADDTRMVKTPESG